MPQRLDPIRIHPRLGVIDQVDSSLLTNPDSGYVFDQINMHSDVIGQTTVRNGITLIGAQIVNNYPILGLYNFRDAGSGTNNALLAVVSDGTNSDIYSWGGTNWAKSLEDDTKDLKTRFTTFSDYVIRVNTSDNMKAWVGTGAWSTTGNPINVDQMASYDCAFIEVMADRVFTAGNLTVPDRLYFSSTTDVSGNISWFQAGDNSGYIDINRNDGDNITGLKRYGTTMLIFKKNYLYRLSGAGLNSTVDPDPVINIGTHSQESIVEGKGGIYFHHPKGFFVYSGGIPQEISRAIYSWVSAIPVANYSNISGWSDSDHVYWSVGDVTINGIACTNVVYAYTISSNVWQRYSYPTELKAGIPYYGRSTTAEWTQVVGDDDGNVFYFNNGTTDNGTAISYSAITHFYDMSLLSANKIIQKMMFASIDLHDANVSWQRRGEPIQQWHPVGQLQRYHQFFNDLNIQGNEIRFKIYGANTETQGYFRFIEILDLISEGIQR